MCSDKSFCTIRFNEFQKSIRTEIGSFSDFLDPETDIMVQFLGPETDRMCQFLGPETDVMGERYYISITGELVRARFLMMMTNA